MKADKNHVFLTRIEIEELGYTTELVATNKKKPYQTQQMFVYKNDEPVAKVSLMVSCRINTMFNGVGKGEVELLQILGKLSMNI